LANIKASQDEPDFFYAGFRQRFPTSATDKEFFIQYGQPGRNPSRFWREISESTLTGRLDGQIELDLGLADDVKIRSGVLLEETERSFKQDYFYLGAGSNSTGSTVTEVLEDIARPFLRPLDASGNNAAGRIVNTVPAGATADRKLSAAHLGFTLPIVAKASWAHRFDFSLGARVENYRLGVSGRASYFNESSADFYLDGSTSGFFTPAQVGANPGPATVYSRTLDERTVHPSAAFTWSPIDRFNVRLAYSRTVARPSFRELGPYFSNDDVTNEVQHGNVYLDTSKVENADFRVEYFFPKSRDILALSLFTKTIERPIEKAKIIGKNNEWLTWFNNDNDATMRGAELEAAKNLGFLGEAASRFTAGGNATLIDAKVRQSRAEAAPAFAKDRTLFDQPEWIANAYLSFDHGQAGFSSTLSWFAISDVLRSVDPTTWNTFVASHSRFDLTLNQRFGSHWQVRLSAKNLADPDREFIADPAAATDGVTLRKFKDGRNYSLTATYDF
jgi:TonB-dependent receptor